MSKNQKISRNVNGVVVQQREVDGYVNATQLCKAHRSKTGERKDPSEWLSNRSSISAISKLSEITGIPVIDLGQSKPGTGTWIHPRLAVRFAMWLSDDFSLQVEDWVHAWMVTGQNPIWSQVDVDRVEYRNVLKDEARLRMTDQVKIYLEQIRRYDDKRHRGFFFARVHDGLNTLITTETSKQMRVRLSKLLGREVKECELIRDYFPPIVLQRYISMCEATANLMIREGFEPLTALERSAEIVLPANYLPKPINFVEDIKLVRGRVAAFQSGQANLGFL